MVNVASCKRIGISEFGKFLLVESGFLGHGVRNIAQGIRNPFNDWTNPQSKFHWQRLESSSWNQESMACNPESNTTSFPGSLSRSVGTGRREPWERGWSLLTLGETIRFTRLIEKVYNSLFMFFFTLWHKLAFVRGNSNVTIHFGGRRGAASFRSEIAPKSPFLCVLGKQKISGMVFAPVQKPSGIVWRVIGSNLFGVTRIIFWVTRFTYISNVTLNRNGVCRTPIPPPRGRTLITFPT